MIAALLTGQCVLAQVYGNRNFRVGNRVLSNNQGRYFDDSGNFLMAGTGGQFVMNLPNDGSATFVVRGLYNVTADEYVAMFSVQQTGRTIEEVNRLMDERIANVRQGIAVMNEVSMVVDMITFLPVYELEKEKKLFSKKTFNEIPTGFELAKNLHISFKDPNQLNALITLCGKQEIYNLIQVDYFSETLGQKKANLKKQVIEALQQKMTDREALLGVEFDSMNKNVADAERVLFPVDMYTDFEMYNNSSVVVKEPGAKVNRAETIKTLYYQAVPQKDFDVVVNPVIEEPVIQIVYELRMRVTPKPRERIKETKTIVKNQYHVVTTDGKVVPLPQGN